MTREPESAIDIARTIENFTPRQLDLLDWLSVKRFTTSVVSAYQPRSCDHARRVMGEVAWLAVWAHCVVGHDLVPQQVLHPGVIDEYVETRSQEWSEKVIRQVRARLRAVAAVANPSWVQTRSYARRIDTWRPEPYTPAEVEGIRDWAAGQGTALRRHGATCLLAMGLGAGLTSTQARLLRVRDIHDTPDGVQLHVRSSPQRMVPVQPEWDDFFTRVRRVSEPDNFVLLPGRSRDDRAVIVSFIARCRAGSAEAPTLSRMRATWMVSLIDRQVPIPAILRAAGLKSIRGYEPWFSERPVVSDADYVRLVRGL